MAEINATAIQTALQNGVAERRVDEAARRPGIADRRPGKAGRPPSPFDAPQRQPAADRPEDATARPARRPVAPRSVAQALAVQLDAQEQRPSPEASRLPPRSDLERGIRAYRAVLATTPGGTQTDDDLVAVNGRPSSFDIRV